MKSLIIISEYIGVHAGTEREKLANGKVSTLASTHNKVNNGEWKIFLVCNISDLLRFSSRSMKDTKRKFCRHEARELWVGWSIVASDQDH